ncbi:MAG TPA: TonB-dependent receptor [Edaphobacter sp.]|nr:TonB-dependent receptor [Edaphobacter sp.]
MHNQNRKFSRFEAVSEVSFVANRFLRHISLHAFSCLLVLSLWFFTVGVVPGAAQVSLSTLRGTVTDSTGAIVTNATVTLNDVTTGTVLRSQKTDSQGNYEIVDLKPGTYQLKCEATGFKSFSAENVILDSAQVRRIDIALTNGELSQQVVVTAGAAVIDTETGSIGGQLNLKQIEEAPQIDAYPSPSVLLTVIPGIQGGTGGLAGLRISGQNSNQQSEAFDGVINDLGGGNSNNPAFFKEITAITVNAPAESARLAYHNLTSRSGSNQLHGSASYKVYSSGLMARNYFAPTRTPYLEHAWQLELGGPIIKDRTFLYGTWFSERIPLGSFARATVPTAAMRAGDFSGVSTQIKDPLTQQPFAGNQIPTNRISPIAQQVQELLYPLPTVNPGAKYYSANNYGFNFPHPSDLFKGDWTMLRLDQNITSKNSIYARWLMRRNPYILQNGLPTELWTRWREEQQWAIVDTHVFSASLVNTATLGLSREYIRDGSTVEGVTPLDGADVLAKIGLQGSNPGNTRGQGIPSFSISGLTGLSIPAGGVQSNNYIYSYLDSLSWSVGRHVWKFGASDQIYTIFTGAIPNYGSFSFDGSMSGNPYADFLLGVPRQSTRLTPISNRTEHAGEFGVFAEDSFKVSQRLTLQYGLRWDYFVSPSYDDKMMYKFDPVSRNVIVPKEVLAKVSPLYKNIPIAPGKVVSSSDLTNFRPRVSAAFRITPTLVLRGGYGAFTERIGYFTLVSGGGPFQVAETYQNQPKQKNPYQFPNPYPDSLNNATVPSQSVAEFPSHVDNGILHQFNVTLEKEVKGVGLRASYIGIRSRGMNYSLNVNLPQPSVEKFSVDKRPYPEFVNVTQYRSDGSANYNSMQFEVRRRTGNFTFDAHYSYQRNKYNYADLENPYDVLSHWTNETATRRHYLVATAIWKLPVGRGQRFLSDIPGPVDAAIGGWQLYFVNYLGSGLYYSPSFSGTNPSNTGISGGLPDLVGDPTPKHRTYSAWWDKDAFALPAQGRFGNALPYSLKGQWINSQHLSVVKTLPITERLKFTFTAAISNLFNHPAFYGVQTNISTPNFGAYTSTFGLQTSNESAAQRQVTFGGKLSF